MRTPDAPAEAAPDHDHDRWHDDGGATAPDQDPDAEADPLAGELLLRPREAAALLSVAPATVYRMVRRGELPAFRIDTIVRPSGRCVRRLAASRDTG